MNLFWLALFWLALPDFSSRLCRRSTDAPLFGAQGRVEFSVAAGAPARLLSSSLGNTCSFIVERPQQSYGGAWVAAPRAPRSLPVRRTSRVFGSALRGTGWFLPAFPAQLP
jgi:hypothetical protein